MVKMKEMKIHWNMQNVEDRKQEKKEEENIGI